MDVQIVAKVSINQKSIPIMKSVVHAVIKIKRGHTQNTPNGQVLNLVEEKINLIGRAR